MLYTFQIIILLLFFSSGGCAVNKSLSSSDVENNYQQNVPITSYPQDYMPLKVGYSWNYHLSYPGQEGKQTISIIKETNGAYFDNTSNSLTFDTLGLRDQQRYLIKTPLKVGTKWYSVTGPSSVEHFIILDMPETCMVHSKVFEKCLIIEGSVKLFEAGVFKTLWTYAKNIGIVEIITFLETNEGKKLTQSVVSLESHSF